MKFLAVCILFYSASLFAQEFVPGSDVIRESDILRRMEDEIGTPSVSRTAHAAEQKKEPEKPEIPQITVHTGKLSRSGNSTLSQKEIVVAPDESLPVHIPMSDVTEITFMKWTLRAAQDRRYYFPSVCKVRRKDGSEITGKIEYQDWLRLDVGGVSMLSYFVSSTGGEEVEASAVPESVVRSLSFDTSENQESARR